MDTTGVVAGGRSTRFGDEALAALDDGERSPRALPDRLAVEYVDTGPARSLTSVDTRGRLREVDGSRG